MVKEYLKYKMLTRLNISFYISNKSIAGLCVYNIEF